MALINCPECNNLVSDMARMCPNCGFPISDKQEPAVGSVYLLSGNRRKPWVACVTEGWDTDTETKKSKQKRIPIGYYLDELSALQALTDFNNNPYDLSKKNMTFAEVYDKWSERKYEKLSESSVSSYTAAYKHCKEIQDVPLIRLKAAELQKVVDNCQSGSNTKANIKVVMSAIFEYGLQNDIVNKNYASFIEFETSDPVIDRILFTRSEIDMLWQLDDSVFARIVLILLYTGMRVNELLMMPRSCCDLSEKSIYIAKAKNKYSIRKVPIHNKIYDYVKEFYEKEKEYLITNDNGYRVAYNNFAVRDFVKLMNQIGQPNHHLHDTRHTFITTARNHMDKLLMQKIVGHKPVDITDEVYTHIQFSQLLNAINQIKKI